MDARELLDAVMVDDLYFQATGGGVTFGGGEPLLRSRTIAEFCRLCPPGWHVGIETSLAVPQRRLAEVTPYVHRFIIDVKDMNPDIYRRYTGCDNSRVTANLGWLARNVDRSRVVIRLPRIPSYNTPADVARSRRQLEDMGFTLFDCFDYLLP
jgi:pyruvate formate lyase activating enzyme